MKAPENVIRPDEPRREIVRRPKRNRAVLLLVSRAKKHLREGRLKEALAALERAYAIDYKDAEVSYYMSKSLFSTGKEVQAEQWALRAITLWGDESPERRRDAWKLIAQCRLKQGDTEGARQAIVTAQNI